MRLFIAINFNDEIKSKIMNAIRELSEKSIDGNFTKPENLHLTVAFIGETNNLKAVKKVLDSLEAPCFDISIGQGGRFHRGGKDIFWVGIDECEELKRIHKHISNGLRECGFSVDDREYRPHITLGREVICSEDIKVRKGSMTVRKISLMKSERVGGELKYSEIYHKKLVSD